MAHTSRGTDTLLDVGQVAAALGVTAETVRRYLREKRISAQKLPRKGLKAEWAICLSDLKAFAAAKGLTLKLSAIALSN